VNLSMVLIYATASLASVVAVARLVLAWAVDFS
jgi:hypothetical protein